MKAFSITLGAVCLIATAWTLQGAVTSISEINGDAGRFAIIEPEKNGVGAEGTLFGEDAWIFTDRTHEYNGVAFDSTGLLVAGVTPPAGATIVGLPNYLMGHQYIANANQHRDNAGYQLTLNLDSPCWIYLLIDNRLGDNVNNNPPALGSGGAGLMPWVADKGFRIIKTGISPNGQPDFVGADEGGQLNPQGSFPDLRTHGTSGLGAGPGMELNNFYTVYGKYVTANQIVLGEQNGGGLNMYGVVVVPEPTVAAFLGLGFLAALLRRRRS